MTQYDRLPNREAIAHFNGKVILTAQDYAQVKAYEHALAFTVAKIADKDMLKEVHQAMKEAIQNGTTFYDFQKRLKPYLLAKGWLAPVGEPADEELKAYQKQLGQRLKTIYHTNKQTAYAAGQWQRIQRTKEFFPYLQYMPSLSVNQRDGHKRYYHLVRPVDDPIWASIMPPNGFGCKCWVKQLTKTDAQKIGISDDDKLHDLPKPDFDHNHDRLTALLKLAEDKHGMAFGEKIRKHLDEMMLGVARDKGVIVVGFQHILPNTQNALTLSKDPHGNNRLSEGVLADKWEQYHNVKLERYDAIKHKVLVIDDPADYAVISGLSPKLWKTLDFMFTLEPGANKTEFNRSFNKSGKAWEKRKARIVQHLEKADIIPMYLKYMNTETRVKIISFVLSLPQEYRKKIVLIKD